MIERRTFQLPGKAVALVLAGGRGSRLFELTDSRAKPAVYFGGKYRSSLSTNRTVCYATFSVAGVFCAVRSTSSLT